MEVLETKIREKELGVESFVTGEIKSDTKEATYGGLELVKDKEYTGGTSIKYWM